LFYADENQKFKRSIDLPVSSWECFALGCILMAQKEGDCKQLHYNKKKFRDLEISMDSADLKYQALEN